MKKNKSVLFMAGVSLVLAFTLGCGGSVATGAAADAKAETAFIRGEKELEAINSLVIKGNEKEKLDMIKKIAGILQNAKKHYEESASYGSEKWTMRAKNRIAEQPLIIASKIREQEIEAKDKERLFIERIQLAKQMPAFYEQARPLFQANIDFARERGYYNPDVVAAQDSYIETYYRDCQSFDEVGNAFAEAPLPDSLAMIKEFVSDGINIEDAIAAAHEDLEAYREELKNRSLAAKQGTLPRCISGIKAAAHYGIKNKWTDSLFILVNKIDFRNEILKTEIKEFKPK